MAIILVICKPGMTIFYLNLSRKKSGQANLFPKFSSEPTTISQTAPKVDTDGPYQTL